MFENMSRRQQRQALAPIFASLILIGVAGAIGVGMLTFGQDFIGSASKTGPIEIDFITLQNSGGLTYVSAGVTNTSDQALANMKIIIYVGTEQMDAVLFNNISVGVGADASETSIVQYDGTAKFLPKNTSALVEIVATGSTGTIKSELKPIRVY
ncbi:MAG: hypothetical protein HRU07_09950 [Nitrosopumilus sp.]|nr:hypothetical protein [Nitrosopumilus sp.]NRA06450.1 hypothetical protein [Nitrosopumilus sp.]